MYLCAKYTDESRSIKMIIAKTRVAPLTNQSIPRIELLRALILSRLIKTVKGALLFCRNKSRQESPNITTKESTKA